MTSITIIPWPRTRRFNAARDLERKVLNPHFRCFSIKRNGSSGPDQRQNIGRFYEGLTRALYGGKKIAEHRNLGSDYRQFLLTYERGDSADLFKPDVCNLVDQTINESKASREKTTTPIRILKQMRRMELVQEMNEHLRTNYVIYSHTLPDKSKDYEGDPRLLPAILARNTSYALHLPLSFMLSLVEQVAHGEGNHSIGYFSSENGSLDLNLHDSFRLNLFAYPDVVLGELGMSDDYDIRLLNTPDGLRLKNDGKGCPGTKVFPFPITQLVDRDHRSWFVGRYGRRTAASDGLEGLFRFGSA